MRRQPRASGQPPLDEFEIRVPDQRAVGEHPEAAFGRACQDRLDGGVVVLVGRRAHSGKDLEAGIGQLPRDRRHMLFGHPHLPMPLCHRIRLSRLSCRPRNIAATGSQARATSYHHTAPRRRWMRGSPCGGLSGRSQAGTSGSPPENSDTATSGSTPNSAVMRRRPDLRHRRLPPRQPQPGLRSEQRIVGTRLRPRLQMVQARDPFGGQRVGAQHRRVGNAPAGRTMLSQQPALHALQPDQRRGKPVRIAGQHGGAEVGVEFAGPRQRHLQQAADGRRGKQHGDGEPRHAAFGAAHIAAEVEDQRNDADRRHQRGEARNHVGQRHDLDVLVGDVADLMREHAGQFARGQRRWPARR